MRMVWLSIGLTSVVFGAVGTAVPFLPTVPFLIVASYAFARSSERYHNWLVTHPVLGPPLALWHEQRAISSRAKRHATVSILVALGLAWFAGFGAWTLALQAAVLACVLVFLWTRPTPV